MATRDETAEYIEALRKIIECNRKPMGKGGRMAKKIAQEALAKWGRCA